VSCICGKYNVKYNEEIDTLAKEASIKGEDWDSITCKDIMINLEFDYKNIDRQFLSNDNKINVGIITRWIFAK